MKNLYTTGQVRALDAWAIANAGVDGKDLMRRAGGCCYQFIRERWPRARSFAVLTGPGNNGGDGWVAARQLAEAGDKVTVYELAKPAADSDAGVMRAEYFAGGFDKALSAQDIREADLMIDAMFGSGLTRALSGTALTAVRAFNRMTAPVLAVDVPSGLDSDRGVALPVAVRADATLTFVGRKRGMYTGTARTCCGEVVFDSLGVDAEAAQIDSDVRLADASDIALPARDKDMYKGRCGRVLVVGGNTGFGGAVRMTGEAAIRSGAGLVNVALRPGNLVYAAACPEMMACEIDNAADLDDLLAVADVVAVGPGLGRDAWATGMFSKVLDSGKPLVVDADGLHLLSREPLRRDDWILTPHPGEAAALSDVSVRQVEADRFAAVNQIAKRYGGVCVLKGAGTVVGNVREAVVCDVGNPAMAVGGMGDVLTGVIAGVWAQCIKGEWDKRGWCLLTTARTAVCVHGAAADTVAGGRCRGLLATDLLPHLMSEMPEGNPNA